jgi:hypothetical protein
MSSTESDTAFSTASDDHHSGKDDGSRKKIKVSSQPAKAREQSSKKRGRPQKVQDAQTPAERRRAQVRLAQRAYRSRQEATVSQLKNRIVEMESVIETMTEAFLAFSDRLMQSGVLNASPDIAQSLKEITLRRKIKHCPKSLRQNSYPSTRQIRQASHQTPRSLSKQASEMVISAAQNPSAH